jgi:hypothetical protein
VDRWKREERQPDITPYSSLFGKGVRVKYSGKFIVVQTPPVNSGNYRAAVIVIFLASNSKEKKLKFFYNFHI